MINATSLWSTCTICCFSATVYAGSDQSTDTEALVRVIDLNVGESQSVRLCDGKEVSVKLLDLQERRDPIRQA